MTIHDILKLGPVMPVIVIDSADPVSYTHLTLPTT